MARRAKRRKGGPSYEEVMESIDEKESAKPLTKKQEEQERRKKLRLEAESEKESKTPKLNVKTVSSAVFGKNEDFSKSIKSIHGTISKLTGHVRKAVIRIKDLESRTEKVEEGNANNSEKITRIKNILQSQKSKIGEKIPGSDKDTIEKTLIETNKILVQIQQELMRSSALRAKEEKEKVDKQKRGVSRAKLRKEELDLEKSSRKIKKSIGEKSEDAVEPVKGIFDRIMDFVKTISLGIAGNAIFEWLKNKENIEKVKGWFSWIKDNWKWMAAVVGAIALIPVVTTIAGILGPLGAIVGFLLKGIPVLIGVLTNPVFLGVAAGAGLLFGMKAAIDTVQKKASGGQAHYDAFNQLKEELKEKGISVIGSGKDEKFALAVNRRGRITETVSGSGTEEQKALVETYKKRRDALIANRDAMRAEMDKQKDAVVPVMKEVQTTGRERRNASTKMVEDRQATEKLRNEAESKVRAQFEANIQGILEARKMGGPVSSGTPYIVGEKGPEIFIPNMSGSVVNNYRTEKIYQMISSRKKGRGGINLVNLPPITNQLPPPELPAMGDQATDVDEISSVNMADPYRQLTPMLYGITV
jgi:hypothetical protein